MYDEELDMALESAYDDGYVQALADMGYELDDEAMEDTELDMFDDDYFEEAIEGNPINKAKKKIWEYEQSGTSGTPEYDYDRGRNDTAYDIARFRERNYSMADDPTIHRRSRYSNETRDRDSRDSRLAAAGEKEYRSKGRVVRKPHFPSYSERYAQAANRLMNKNSENEGKQAIYNRTVPPKYRKDVYTTPVTRKNILHEMNHPSK